jgi:hypothetical protein
MSDVKVCEQCAYRRGTEARIVRRVTEQIDSPGQVGGHQNRHLLEELSVFLCPVCFSSLGSGIRRGVKVTWQGKEARSISRPKGPRYTLIVTIGGEEVEELKRVGYALGELGDCVQPDVVRDNYPEFARDDVVWEW